VQLELKPKQLWMVATGAEAKNFTWCILKFGFRLHSPWGASELSYCGTSVVCRTCT